MTRAHKAPDATHKFSLALHNKYYYNTRYDKLYASLKASDVVILVEAIDNDMEHLKLRFHDTHPFTLPENAKRPDFVLPISKYKIENLVYQNLTDGERPTQGIRFNVRPNDCVDQVTIYTFHAEAPMDGKKSKTQKTQMDSMAQWIKKDTAENNWKNVICAGDWNITPFAPIYDDFLSVTGLKYQVSGVFPVCTWPSFLLFKIFKIPLDHILIDGNLTFVDLKKDESNGSDHHSLIAHFNVKT